MKDVLPRKRLDWALIIAASVLPSLPNVNGYFHCADFYYILEFAAPGVSWLDKLAAEFTSLHLNIETLRTYRPMVAVAYCLNYLVSGTKG